MSEALKKDEGQPSNVEATSINEEEDLHRDNPLFKLSVSDYLEDSVATVLTNALDDLCRVRPANPVDYLALYLLRRVQSHNMVEVPYSEAVPHVETERIS